MKKKHKNQQNQGSMNQNQSSLKPKRPDWQQGSKNGGNKKAKISAIVTAVVIIVAVILGIVFGGDREPNLEKQLKREARQEEKDEVPGFKTQAMSPITEGEFRYQFEGVNWIFEASDEEGVGVPITRVNMMFENFKRRDDGAFATFGNPYKFGIFEGECSEVDVLDYDEALETGIPIAYARCSWQEEGTDIALFQEDTLLVVKSRKSADEPFVEVTSIDLTTVVQ